MVYFVGQILQILVLAIQQKVLLK